jgi:hypothetical protein
MSDDPSARSAPRETLAQLLKARPDLVEVAGALFDYAQYLLDDDERLTKSGALDGQGRELFQKRALELLGGPERKDEPEEDDDAEVDDEDDE